MKHLSTLDLGQNQLQNAVAHPLSAAPSAPKPGQFYFSTSANVLFVWSGTTWRPTDAAALTDGSVPIAALAVNPLARANHTGTQLAATISNLQSTVQSYSLSGFAAPAANIPMAGFTFTGLGTPTSAGQAAEFNWVLAQIQSAAAGIASKPPVAAVATSNIGLSGLSTAIDGYTPSAGDRILVTGQATASQNGVYNAASGAWTRTTIDGSGNGEIEPGALWMVQNGATYAGAQFRVATSGAITVGTTALSIVQFSAANPYSNGAGLSLTGTTFAVNPVAGGGILASASGVQVDTSIVARKVTATITGDGTTTSFPVAHGLGIQAVIVQVYDSSGNLVQPDVVRTSASVATINFGIAPTAGTAYSTTVVG